MSEPEKTNGASIKGMEFPLKTLVVSMLVLSMITYQIGLLEVTKLIGWAIYQIYLISWLNKGAALVDGVGVDVENAGEELVLSS